MDILEITATDESPQIRFNPGKGLLEISGKSLPEHIKEFYQPLEDAVRKYVEQPQQVTNIMFKLIYLNSASTKKILEIVTLFENIAKKGFLVNLYWYYEENDDDMLEEGEGFARLTEIPVQLIEFNNEN